MKKVYPLLFFFSLVIQFTMLRVQANPIRSLKGLHSIEKINEIRLIVNSSGVESDFSNTKNNALSSILVVDGGLNVGFYSTDLDSIQAWTNHTLDFNSVSHRIPPALLTIEAEDKTKVFGHANLGYAFKVLRKYLNEEVTSISTGSFVCNVEADIPALTYEQETLQPSRHDTLVFQSDILEIAFTLLTILLAEAKTKVYSDVIPMAVT